MSIKELSERILRTEYSYIFLVALCKGDRPKTKPENSGLVSKREEFDYNLKSCCVECEFIFSCRVAQEKGGPQSDEHIGMYRFSSLKERCLA